MELQHKHDAELAVRKRDIERLLDQLGEKKRLEEQKLQDGFAKKQENARSRTESRRSDLNGQEMQRTARSKMRSS